MPDAVQKKGETLIINGDHPNVTAHMMGGQRSGKQIVVHVSPVDEKVISLFAEGKGTAEQAYYEGPVEGERVRIKVLFDKSKIGSSENFARLRSTGAPEKLE